MGNYVVLLRGVNVGGKNKLVMNDLCQQVTDMGFVNVKTYINSGNLFFQLDCSRANISSRFEQFFADHYPFV